MSRPGWSVGRWALLMLLVPPLPAQEPRQASVQEGLELLEAGRARDAVREFRGVLVREPENLGAWEGLVWAYLELVEVEEALRAADRRRELAPEDRAWRMKHLELLGQSPSRRGEAVRGYEALVRAQPGNVELWRSLARLLSWSPGRLDEAIEVYREALRRVPADPELESGLARTLMWANRVEEALPLLQELHRRDPSDLEVRRLLAQAARQAGDLDRAARLVRRGLEMHPGAPELLVEEGWIALQRGDLSAADEAARRALSVEADNEHARRIAEAVERATPARLGPRATYSSESTPFRRFVLGLPLEFHPRVGTRIRLRPYHTWFRDSEDDLERRSIEVQLRQDLPWDAELDLLYCYHEPEGVAATHEVDVKLAVRPSGWLSLRGGGRQRALVDEPRDYEDVAYFRGVGSGGTTLDGIRQRLQIREAYGGFTVSPGPSFYGYANGSFGTIDDEVDNRRRSLATGFGVNVLRALDELPTHDLTLKYDYFFLSYTEPGQPAYFSPERFQVHTPGLDYRFRFAEGSIAGIEGGLPLRSGEEVGFVLGAFLHLHLSDSLAFEARWRKIDDTEFEVESITANLTIRF